MSYGFYMCVKILKYYVLFLVFICMFVFILIDGVIYKIVFVINIVLMLFVFYIVKSEKY